MRKEKIIAVLPAYNAENTLQKTYDDIPKNWVDDIILVDDASGDHTVEISKKLGIKTFVHPKNRGYGGNQKTCYKEALKAGGDVMVMIHPDHQYDPSVISQLIEPILDGKADAIFGSRMMIRENALKGGMPRWKYVANIFLTAIENFFLHLQLTEYHSGFRAYSRELLSSIAFEKNSDTLFLIQKLLCRLNLRGSESLRCQYKHIISRGHQ
jgi:glycosyltransferase involved in cell wall biosynthesis